MAQATTEFKIDLSKLSEKIASVRQQSTMELSAFAYNTEADAKMNLTGKAVDKGILRNSIRANVNGEHAEITAAAKYAAYVEFGTGQFAAKYVPALPAEIQDYAMTFFVTGKGRLPATPYLWPAYQKNVELLKENIKRIIAR